MNLLLWVYLTLQINFPLFNINSQQIPGYDYMGGPRPRQLTAQPAAILKVPRRAKLYTCHQRGLREDCKFHNEIYVTQCLFTLSYGHNIPCTQWKGFLL